MDSPSAVTPVTPPTPPLVGPPPPPPQLLPAALPAASARRVRLPWVVAGLASAIAVLAVVALAVTLVNGGTDVLEGAEPVERGFATPEEAVTYVTERIADGDLASASEAFATVHMVDGYSFEASANHVHHVGPTSWLPVDAYRELALGMRQGQVAQQLRSYVWQLTAPGLDENLDIELSDEGRAAEIAADLDPAELAGLSIQRVDVLGGDSSGSRRVSEQEAADWGADDFVEVGMLVETPSGTAMGGMQLLEYDGRWYVMSLHSFMLGLFAELSPTTPTEYAGTVSYLRAANSE